MAKTRNPTTRKEKAAPSTRRSTGGPGFAFEDQVAAWLMLKTLTGQPLPGIEGTGTQLQMQTASLGWHIDDVLLTACTDAGNDRRAAISCKSNVQVSSSGLPKDFAERAWRQWAQAGGPFNAGGDTLMLATRGRHPEFDAAWADLKNAARGADTALAVAQIRATEKHRKIFDAVKRAANGIVSPVSDSDVVALIKRIEVEAFDFDLIPSRDERTAVGEARRALATNTLAEGRRLWTELVTKARDTRLGSGTLDLVAMRRSLAASFALKDFPDFESSWARLRALTADYKATIEDTLPNGVGLKRKTEIDALTTMITANTVSVVFGDSGTGKSALVKAALDSDMPSAKQVWLGPEALGQALSEAHRTSLGLSHRLINTLDATVPHENILVIDAAEHLGPARQAVRALVDGLAKLNDAERPRWRIVIVGQTLAWEGGDLQQLAGSPSVARHEVKALPPSDVRAVLRTTEGLDWLASQDEAVSALTNLRTLSWVIQASSTFQSGNVQEALSLVAIADRLWKYWTGGKAAVQRLLMRLGDRDAAFEHSFAISQLDGADANAFDNRPEQCPLRVDTSTGSIKFEHDLAADWARFQRLKEIAGDTGSWAAYAANPLWHGALRMLGQLLLRRPSGSRTAWDDAFDALEKASDALPVAADLLLDALFLDPFADQYLDQRADFLLANNGKRLQRLLRRFEHVASVPGANPEVVARFPDISLYIEAQFRTPIVTRWPAIARFLSKHKDRVAVLALPIVSTISERWLTSTPATLGAGVAMPFRKEFAELSVANARALQLELAKHVIHVGDDQERLHSAAFAAATDLTTEVADWALEMAKRRPRRSDIEAGVRADRQRKDEEHAGRMKTDTDYRERHERRRNVPVSIPTGRRLSPWPLGPNGHIDHHFENVVLRGATFPELMRAAPAVASEVLLAAMIDGQPEEQYGSRSDRDEGLGLTYDHDGYPSAYWKSQFLPFLQINHDVALDALLRLVEFCTDRWADDVRKRRSSAPPTLSVRLADGTIREFRGSYSLFKWSQGNSPHTGQLHSALAALERWLYEQIDSGMDVAPTLARLLRSSDSIAVLGVLVNVGKYRPELFRGVLKPLLLLHAIYVWDSHRVTEAGLGFDGYAWLRAGADAFDMAQAWRSAPHRRKRLQVVAAELISEDNAMADVVRVAAAQWTSPTDDKSRVEFQMLVAELNSQNYTQVRDPGTGDASTAFAYPADVLAAIHAFQTDGARAREALTFPDQCRNFLSGSGLLPDALAEAVAGLMAALDGDEEVDLDEDMKRPARVACAAVLLLRAKAWLASRPTVQARAQKIIDACMAELADDADRSRFRYSVSPSYLEFAAYWAMETWIGSSSAATDEAVLRLLTSGDDRAARVIAWAGYRNRRTLGGRWWNLLYLSLLWAGLSILKPSGYDDEAPKDRFRRWFHWFCTRRLRNIGASRDKIRPLDIAERVERFEAREWGRRYAEDGRKFKRDPRLRMSGGLNTHILEIAFSWLFDDAAAQELDATEIQDRQTLILAFWAHEAWCRAGSSDDEDDDYKPLSQFGYKLADELARMTKSADVASSGAFWSHVFELGPKGHYAIGTYLTDWFSLIDKATDAAEFGRRWRPMIEHMRGTPGWSDGRQWHYGQQLERQVLGFGSSSQLMQIPGWSTLANSMRGLYRDWAAARLKRNEDNLAGLCAFLSFDAGAPLRLEGLQWIADAISSNPDGGRWYRDRTSDAFMELLATVVQENLAEVSANEPARKALLALAAHAVARQLRAALAVQERIRRGL